MKKIQTVFLLVFLAGCSSSPIAPSTATPGIVQTTSLLPTQTIISPTQTLTPTSTSTPTLAPTALGGGAGKIAFTSERDGYQEIYVVNSDGSNLIKLTNSITPKFDPAWSPDGKQIAFGSVNNNSGNLYIMNADGSNPTKLIDTKGLDSYAQTPLGWRAVTGCCHPIWSPDGKKIVLRAVHYAGCCLLYINIYMINADGSNLISVADHPAYDNEPAWSPDSQKIAFDSSLDKTAFDSNSCGGTNSICVMNADGTDSHPINQKGGGPIWSPDGKKIAFNTSKDGNGEVYVMNADGSNPINLTHYNMGWDGGPVWSPDGKKIVFSSYRDGNFEIYVMNADGTDPFNLTNNQAADYNQVWSPDGKKIVFVSERDGNPEIYVMNADGTNPINLTNSDAKDYSPVWSP